MKYALDADHNLVPGDDLTYAYMGSGVATFTDGAGTGFRVPIGTRNLAGVSADGTVYLEDEGVKAVAEAPVSFATGGVFGGPMPKVGYPEGVIDEVVIPNVPEPRFSDYTNRQLEDLCHEREIPFKYHPNKAALIGLLEDAE